MTPQKYYKIFNDCIEENPFIFDEKIKKDYSDYPLPMADYSDIINVLDQVYKKYDFDLHKQLQPNYTKFVLWQLSSIDQRHESQIKIAIKWILFCCLADKFLDSVRFTVEQKKAICKKLDVKWFTQPEQFVSNEFEEMDILLNDIRKFITSKQIIDCSYFSQLIKSIQNAFVSEIYMSTTFLDAVEPFKNDSRELLIDKSVEFERVAFMLSVLPESNNKIEKIAISMGEIMWLIDDLCDFVEDVQCKRKNSLLYMFIKDDDTFDLSYRVKVVSERLSTVFFMIHKRLELIKNGADESMYSYMIFLVRDWCENVRDTINQEIKT